MKKLICIFMCVSMLLCFFGCTKATQNELTTTTVAVEKEVTSDSTTENNVTSATKITTVKKSTVAQKGTTAFKSTGDTKKTTATKASISKAKKTTKGTTAKKITEKKTTAKATSAKHTTAKKTTTSAYISCSVFVECKSILNNMNDLKAGHESYVPSDGNILSFSAVTVKNGSTVYEAVKLACENRGVSLNVVNSGYGKYIAGFNNIDERDCGRDSGWKYKVNGIYPSKSCDKYILKDGDRIEFTYVCNYS